MWHWNVPSKNQGFTLIEVLTVTIIISIVAAIAAPNLLGLLNRNRVNQGLTQLEGAIKEAQRQAIRTGKSCTITLDTANNNISGGCLLNTRDLNENLEIGTNLDENGTTDEHDIDFSAKGNMVFDIGSAEVYQGAIFVVYMSNGTTQQKCLVVESILGSVRTGDYIGSTPETPTLETGANPNCD